MQNVCIWQDSLCSCWFCKNNINDLTIWSTEQASRCNFHKKKIMNKTLAVQIKSYHPKVVRLVCSTRVRTERTVLPKISTSFIISLKLGSGSTSQSESKPAIRKQTQTSTNLNVKSNTANLVFEEIWVPSKADRH